MLLHPTTTTTTKKATGEKSGSTQISTKEKYSQSKTEKLTIHQ
jgi:hypothetical protein